MYVGTLFYRVRGDLPDGFVRIREGTVRIGPMGFFGCGSLRRIVFPAGLWEIGEYAFFNCGGLGETVVPESVSAIGERAFQGCRSMGRITLPAGLERLGPHVFFDCPGLTVRAPAGSTAAGYAREAGFPLEEDPN